MVLFHDFWFNFTHNLFKPLLLFFYMGLLIPLLRVKLEFPKALSQGLTVYLLIAIGWHGGEQLASVKGNEVSYALGFLVIGFIVNICIGWLAYLLLCWFTRLRAVDAATVAGYYGSDSVGTFATCLGVLLAGKIAYAPYMPVVLAVMEVPGCLVALFLVSRLRRQGMDKAGYLPGDAEYLQAEALEGLSGLPVARRGRMQEGGQREENGTATAVAGRCPPRTCSGHQHHVGHSRKQKAQGIFDWKVLHEVFFNPALYLLFGGILIGFVSRLQGTEVTKGNDPMFVTLFQGALCLFLLEMGMTACQRIKDLKSGGWRFVMFGILAPNVFATIGIFVAHIYSLATGHPFELGTYALFAVLCGAASYITVPAVQRMAIPEASPTLPLAASLGLTFTWNVTVGIPLYIEIAKGITLLLPVVTA